MSFQVIYKYWFSPDEGNESTLIYYIQKLLEIGN